MRRWWIAIICVALAATVQAEERGDETEPEDPRFTPTVKWLPEPFPVKDSAASTEQEMKPYTEQISGTGVTFDMVPIPGGEFLMGSPPDEPKREEDEGPQHRVQIEPFWMGKHEVTWNEFEMYIDGIDYDRRKYERREPTKWDLAADAMTCPSMTPFGDPTLGEPHDGHPAVNMTHFVAKLYCKWLSAKTGRYYRLPTEAEWEYACRAGTTTAYSFGNDPSELKEHAWYFDNSPDFVSRPGLKKPNPWGLYDMHGNVAEWVLDQYSYDFYTRSQGQMVVGPLAVPTTMYPNVVRGGSCDDDPEGLRSAARHASDPDWSMQDPQIPQNIFYHTEAWAVGLRVVRPLRVPDVTVAASYEITPEDALRFRKWFSGFPLPLKEPKDLLKETKGRTGSHD